MIKITKGQEPQSWVKKRQTAGATYSATSDLQEALLKEQGYICAYCMRRVPVTKNDPGNNEKHRIDHINSRTDNPGLQLVYNNMVICCPGCIDGNAHCDKLKGKSDISFSPFDQNLENSISYSTKDGTISSSNETWQEEFNSVLNLNNELLKLNRSYAIDGARTMLGRRQWKEAELRKLLRQWEEEDKEGKLKPYCGVVLWYLRRAIRKNAQ